VTDLPKIITPDELPGRGIRYSRMHLRRLIKAGQFPAPVALSANRIGFVETEVAEWLLSRPRVAYSPTPRASA
jgi:prophage regulatory protein